MIILHDTEIILSEGSLKSGQGPWTKQLAQQSLLFDDVMALICPNQ